MTGLDPTPFDHRMVETTPGRQRLLMGMTGLDSVIPDVRRPDQGWQRFPLPTAAPLNCQAQFSWRAFPALSDGIRAFVQRPGFRRLIDPVTRITSLRRPLLRG